MRHKIFIPVFIAIMFSFGSHPAWSQDSGFVIDQQPITTDDVELVSVDFDQAFGMIDNPFLSDVIKLNYQINLLQKMVERQAGIEQISESFQSMGVNFNEPAPPRGICEQLPANAACLKFYPELYPDLVNRRRAYYEELKAKAAAANPKAINEGETPEQAAAREAKAEAERRAREAKAERKSRYKWTEVSCVSGACRGVLIATEARGFRTTVHEGSKLTDGTLVQEVSADGIRVNIDGDIIHVRPAPQDENGEKDETSKDPTERFNEAIGGDASDAAPSSADDMRNAAADVVKNAESAGGNEGGTSAAVASTTDTDNTTDPAASNAAASGQTMAEPALGPSGLF